MKKRRHRNHLHRSKKVRDTRISETDKKNNWDPMFNWKLSGECWTQWRKDMEALKRFVKQAIKCIISILLFRFLNK